MTAETVIAALTLPEAALVGRRVPKRLLIEQGAPTPSDKTRIQEGVEELFWVASLKPTTVGIPAYRDTVREYLEIQVLRLSLRETAKSPRLLELLHRAIPYPVLLLCTQGKSLVVSTAHKRWSEAESGKMVLDGDIDTAALHDVPQSLQHQVAPQLPLSRLPSQSLLAVYQAWEAQFLACQAAPITGELHVPATAEEITLLRALLRDHNALAAEAARIRKESARERQLARQVEQNLQLRRIEAEMDHKKSLMTTLHAENCPQ